MATASLINRLSHAVDQIEQRMQQKRPWKVVKVRCGYHEDRNVARDRHYAAHPEDRDANIVILDFCDDEEIAAEGQGLPRPPDRRARTLKTAGQDVSDAGRIDDGRTDRPGKRGHTLYNRCIS